MRTLAAPIAAFLLLASPSPADASRLANPSLTKDQRRAAKLAHRQSPGAREKRREKMSAFGWAVLDAARDTGGTARSLAYLNGVYGGSAPDGARKVGVLAALFAESIVQHAKGDAGEARRVVGLMRANEAKAALRPTTGAGALATRTFGKGTAVDVVARKVEDELARRGAAASPAAPKDAGWDRVARSARKTGKAYRRSLNPERFHDRLILPSATVPWESDLSAAVRAAFDGPAGRASDPREIAYHVASAIYAQARQGVSRAGLEERERRAEAIRRATTFVGRMRADAVRSRGDAKRIGYTTDAGNAFKLGKGQRAFADVLVEEALDHIVANPRAK